jgi:Tol biopolymer transport system component
MPDLQEVFRMSTQKVRPDPGALQRQQRAQRRRAAGRKYGAIGLVAALAVVAAAVVLATRPPGESTQPADTGTPPVSSSPSTGGPAGSALGAQIITADGKLVRVVPGVPPDAYRLTISPDGSMISYVAGGYVSTIGIDGTGAQTLTQEYNVNSGDAQDGVSWSPNGRQLTYALNGDIYVMDADGTNIRQLTTDPSGDYNPAWSPDGSTIAYWNGDSSGLDGGPGNSEIYTIPAAGGSPTRLTHDDVSNIEPAWSPDSARIAYWSGGELWVMNADGTNQHRIYRGSGGAWSPSWSPNGKRIAFLRFDDNPSGHTPLMQILVLDLTSGVATPVPEIRTATDWNGPVWVSNRELLINRYS